MNKQQKSILKTIAILVVAMVTILVLFLNKITTPRYLSDIELRINGLILVKSRPELVVERSDSKTETSFAIRGKWVLLSQNPEQQTLLEDFLLELKPSIKKQTVVLTPSAQLLSQTQSYSQRYKNTIAIVNPQNQLIAYFKPPFDQHKMILTYSSVFTHR